MYLYLETERLLVRQYTINDIDELHKIMSDVRVHTYTKDINNPWNENRTKEYIQFMINKDFRTLDCFHGAVIEKSTNRLIGLCGLNPYKENDVIYNTGDLARWMGNGEVCHMGRSDFQVKLNSLDTHILNRQLNTPLKHS